MPDDNSQVKSPFEMVTSAKPKKKGKGIVAGILIVFFLIGSVVAGVLLVRQQQNIQEKASGAICPDAQACPVSGQPDLLKSCTPSNADGTPTEISCSSLNKVGTISRCGTRQFCCPSLGASWTTDLTLCSTATPTATPTATASPTATATATGSPTATGSATPTAQATPRAIPVTGTDWPTVLGAGVGILVIVASILIAL